MKKHTVNNVNLFIPFLPKRVPKIEHPDRNYPFRTYPLSNFFFHFFKIKIEFLLLRILIHLFIYRFFFDKKYGFWQKFIFWKVLKIFMNFSKIFQDFCVFYYNLNFTIVRFQLLWRFFRKKKRHVSNNYGAGKIFEKGQFLKKAYFWNRPIFYLGHSKKIKKFHKYTKNSRIILQNSSKLKISPNCNTYSVNFWKFCLSRQLSKMVFREDDRLFCYWV